MSEREDAGRETGPGNLVSRSVEEFVSQLRGFTAAPGGWPRILDPLVEWSATWARLEESVADLVRGHPHETADPRPGGGEPASGLR